MNLGQFLPFIVLIAAFYFLLIRPQRNRQREMKSLMSQLRPGQKVMTTAGMFATVTEVDADQVSLEIAPGVVVRYMAAAVAKVVQDDTPDVSSAPISDGADAPVVESD